MDFTQLLADLLNHPTIKFLGVVLGCGIFTRLVMNGLQDRLKTSLAKHLTAHLLGPGIALFLFMAGALEMPRPGWQGYIAALGLGWAGAWGAKGWHHMRKA